ncbi:MAG: choice-of-anchor D domain-containing protein [Akkermansiaceae bacterium]
MKPQFAPLLIAGSTSLASALTFHPVTDLETPNMIEGNPGGNPLTNIIEGPGVGFDFNPPHNRLGGTWYTDAPGGFPSDYIVSNPGDEIIILDFGADTTLFELSYWGYADTNGNGLREFEVRFATDAEGGDPGLGDEAFGTSITLNPSFTALNDQTIRQSFGFGGGVTARYVEIKAITNYFDIVVGGDRLGIGEFSSAQPSAVGNPDLNPITDLDLTLSAVTPTTHDLPALNTGDQDLEVSSVTFTGPNAAAFSTVTPLPASITPFSNGPLQIQFDPAGLGGPISAIATIQSNDPDQPSAQVNLTGTLPALGPDLVAPSPFEIALLEETVQTFTLPITNNGGQDLTISGVSFTGTNMAAFSLQSLPGVIAPGGSGDITFEADTSLLSGGAIDATMAIESDDVAEPTTNVVLSGGLPLTFHPIATTSANTNDFYPLENLTPGIGIGFEEAWPHNSIGPGTPASSTWVTDAPNGGAGDYYDNGQAAPVIIFDLGANVGIGEINTWGYSTGNTNGAKDFTLRFATEAEGGEPGLGDENFGTSITYSPSFEAAFDTLARDAHAFDQVVTARYVEMTITDNWRALQGGTPGGDRVGLGEVAFPFFPGGPDLFLKIVDTNRLENGDFAITFHSSPGITYELERSVEQSDDGLIWELLPDTVVGSPDATSVITDTNTPTDANVALYRIIQR